MAKSRVNCTIDEDLAAQFKDANYSSILNNALRAMANTEINVPYYAKRKQECEDELASVSEKLEYITKLLDEAKDIVKEYTPQYINLEERRLKLLVELESTSRYLDENANSELKLQLTIEINNAIRKCAFVREDIERTVSSQIAEMQRLVPSFDIVKQIEIVKEWS